MFWSGIVSFLDVCSPLYVAFDPVVSKSAFFSFRLIISRGDAGALADLLLGDMRTGEMDGVLEEE